MIKLRRLEQNDEQLYKELVRGFYSSEAVLHTIPDSHIDAAFAELIRSDGYTVCYIIEYNDITAGYVLLARHFSQEAGGIVIWIEELYLLPQFRGLGIGTEVFSQLFDAFPDAAAFRLEVEPDNTRAAALYSRLGFKPLVYSQMIKSVR